MTHRAPLFSLITVCWNAGELLRPTMESVRMQTCNDFEYIVIDGASIDGTAAVVESFGSLVSNFVSEPDKGIYDAMNKGVRLARGDWIYFLNANDFFADALVLEHVAEKLALSPDAELVYGDVYHRTDFSSELYRFDWVSRRNLRLEHLCHQAVFARRRLFEVIGCFDLQYRINADYDWLLKVFQRGLNTRYVGFPVASYDLGGISSRDPESVARERQLVRRRNRGSLFDIPFEWVHRIGRMARFKRIAGKGAGRKREES